MVLGWGIARPGIAQPYADPVEHVRAQDESLYATAAIGMARNGGWLTPKVAGRLFLVKPPLLMVLAGAAVRVFGYAPWVVRLPSVLFGALAAVAVLLWVRQDRGNMPALLAAGLVLSSGFWNIYSHLCYTDVIACACAAVALTAIALDPRVQRTRTAVLFGVFAGLSVMAKSVAGVLPVAAVALYWFVTRPRLRGLAIAAATFTAVAVPWHVYQCIIHPDWFWADYVQLQLLNVGVSGKTGGFYDRPAWFYAVRLWQLDPVLAVLGAIGIFGLVRRRTAPLALCWIFVTVLALLVFRSKSTPYTLLLVLPLAVAAGLAMPRFAVHPAVTAAIVALAFLVNHPSPAPVIEGSQAMAGYAQLHRPTELIAVSPDDEFSSLTLPLHVRYCFLDPSGDVAAIFPHYAPLGVLLTSSQFIDRAQSLPVYRQRLHTWGVDSVEAIGSAITVRTAADLGPLIRALPSFDFYVPASALPEIGEHPAHREMRYSASRVFLLSTVAGTTSDSASR